MRSPACLLCLFLGTAVYAAGEADITLGGPGDGNGKIGHLVDLAFDREGNLYVLDGIRYDTRLKQQLGNLLVQRFDPTGHFLSQFSIRDDELGDNNEPTRLAVDSQGNIYITQPKAGLVQQFSPEGKLLARIALPSAYALAVRTLAGQEQILVARRPDPAMRGPIQQLDVISPLGQIAGALNLSRPLSRVEDLTTDAQGRVYALADTNQLYVFNPQGQLLRVIGAGTSSAAQDGSELHHSIAVDSAGNIYGLNHDGGQIVKFDPQINTVTRTTGEFDWYDAWRPNVLAIDPQDRLWVGVPGWDDGKGRYHFRPCVMRTRTDFYDPKRPGVVAASTLSLGLRVSAQPNLPDHIGYDLTETSVDFIVAPANRQINDLTVVYHIYDTYKTEIAGGKLNLPLQDGQEARQPIIFTPPKWGWYIAEFEAYHQDVRVAGIACHLGFTPKFPGLPALSPGESTRGWDDPARQAFCGLMLHRVGYGPNEKDKLEQAVQACAKYGVTLFCQINDTNLDAVRELVTAFKGRVKYWEIINEPNLRYKPEEYVQILKTVYPLIKEIDPQAQVLGPAVCGVQLPWLKGFYEAGGGKLVDILTIHDYEGHESIDHIHWLQKLGVGLRELMTAYGDADKPVWQTERGILGVRTHTFMGNTQAVRITLHRDLLTVAGIPSEHNMLYYLNQGGYGAYPAYIWSNVGPHPAALALRTRHAMTLGRTYVGQLDFGPTGNKILLGLRYTGDDGQTIILRNLGTLDQPVELQVKGANSLQLVDAFGNVQQVPVRNSRATVTASVMPIYLRLSNAQQVMPAKLDFGRDLSQQVSFSYSADLKPDMSVLTNGIWESPHFGDPHQYRYWQGELPSLPQSLEIAFPHPRLVDKLILWSIRADNTQCALLDYDLQYHDGRRWVTLEEVRAPCPPSEPLLTPDAVSVTWYLDHNFFVHRFNPVKTDRLRIVVHRTTLGFLPDDIALKAKGGDMPAKLMLREIEVYGPELPLELRLGLRSAQNTAAVTREPATIQVTNRTSQPAAGTVNIKPPAGWRAEPSQLTIQVPARQQRSVPFDLIAPPDIPVGSAAVDADLVNQKGELVDYDRQRLTFTSPVQVEPRMPPRIDPAQQPMAVAITNISQQPVSGSARLALVALQPAQPAPQPLEQPFGPLQPNEMVELHFSVPGLKLVGVPWQATYIVTANHLVETAEQDLSAIRMWQVLGPFPNQGGEAFDRDFGPEKGVDLTQTFDVLPQGRSGWKIAASDPNGFVDLYHVFQPNANVCAYAAIYVKSPEARKAILSVGSDDGIKAWLNGQLVIANNTTRAAARGQDSAAVELKAGWNEVLLKITQGTGGWGYYLDILTPNGTPMLDLTLAPGKD